MSLPESSPKLPKWFFLLSDALLIAVAVFIAANSARPLSLGAILAIVACVLTGALLTSAALIADYARRQEDGFDDRQHALEALSRTVATSAEQISIATAGLNELTDLAHKNLKHAEQLPHKLQERVNDFTRQLNEAAVTENETLQQEVNALRAAEAEKLETAGDKIAKATTELAKLESATAKHLAATSEALTKLPEALARARNEAEQALTTAQTRALQSLELKFADRRCDPASRHRLHRHRQPAFHPRRRPRIELGQGRAAAVRLDRQVALGNQRRRRSGAVQTLQERRRRVRRARRTVGRARPPAGSDGGVLSVAWWVSNRRSACAPRSAGA
jgi:hypothetical protein